MSPLRTPSRSPQRHTLLAGLLLAVPLWGCAVPGGTGPDANTLLAELFPAGAGSLRGEAEVTLTLAGRSVTVPGGILLGRGGFRIDLLDPLDRPAAIIFAEGENIVQYRPAGREAALLRPLPHSCRSVLPAGWVPFALGAGPTREGSARYRGVRWFGRDSLVKYEWGSVALSIEYRRRGEKEVPSRVSWYCGDEVAMRLRYELFEGAGEAVPSDFSVEYPLARLKIRVRLGGHERGVPLAEGLFRPPLPPGTRWRGWDLAGEEERVGE